MNSIEARMHFMHVKFKLSKSGINFTEVELRNFTYIGFDFKKAKYILLRLNFISSRWC